MQLLTPFIPVDENENEVYHYCQENNCIVCKC